MNCGSRLLTGRWETAAPVVERIDAAEVGLRFVPPGVTGSMYPLVLQAVEETLRRRIIPTVSLAAHRTNHSVRCPHYLKHPTGVLAAPIRVMHRAMQPTLVCPDAGEEKTPSINTIRTAPGSSVTETANAFSRSNGASQPPANWMESKNFRPHDLLRHKIVRMTERYAHLTPHNVRSAVEALDEISFWFRPSRERCRSRFGHAILRVVADCTC